MLSGPTRLGTSQQGTSTISAAALHVSDVKERQRVVIIKDKTLRRVVIRRPVHGAQIERIQAREDEGSLVVKRRIVIEKARPRVSRHELKPIAESFVEAHLQGIVVGIEVCILIVNR